MIPSEPARGLHVLVADDDPVFRSLVEARLVQIGCMYHGAADGSEAWRLTRDHVFDLAFVDFEMPGLDGIALTRCLRSHAKTRHIPIVMCTSRTDNAAMQSALEAGVSAFLNKPINWSLFERHISHLLQLSSVAAEREAELEFLRDTGAEKSALFLRLVEAMAPLLQHASSAETAKFKVIASAFQHLAAEERATKSTFGTGEQKSA